MTPRANTYVKYASSNAARGYECPASREKSFGAVSSEKKEVDAVV